MGKIRDLSWKIMGLDFFNWFKIFKLTCFYHIKSNTALFGIKSYVNYI